MHHSLFVTLVTLVALCFEIGLAQESCFTSSRFPKIIQSATTQKANQAQAVTLHSGLNAIFVGGKIKTDDLFPASATQTNLAQVGRINLINNFWSWTKLISTTAQDFTKISALAVEPSGTKVAVLGDKPSTFYGFVVLLDTTTGATVSGVLKMVHSGEFRVSSAGMVL